MTLENKSLIQDAAAKTAAKRRTNPLNGCVMFKRRTQSYLSGNYQENKGRFCLAD